MQAITHTTYGGPETLELVSMARPEPGPREIRIRLAASSVNFGDWVTLTGRPWLSRLFLGLFKPRQPIMGMDAAGVVDAVGSEVTRFTTGQRVFGEIRGAYAEYACASESAFALIPEGQSFETAASIPVAGVTALQGLRDVGQVSPGDRVLINGASGGVGSFAVQVARALGAEVTGVCSGRNLDRVRSLGAHHVVNYMTEDFTASDARYDVIFDLVGSASITACRRLLRPDGVYVSSVGRTEWLFKTLWSMVGHRRHVKLFAARPQADDLATLAEMLNAGAIQPLIDQQYTLAEIPQALAYQCAGHTQGKSIITIGS